jgi:hypothetical protein
MAEKKSWKDILMEEQCLELVSVFIEASKTFPFIFIFKKTAKNFNNRLRI